MKTGKVYKIISSLGNEVYIGSTFNTTRCRFQQHKENHRSSRKKCAVSEMFDKYGFENCRIILIKEYMVVDRRHLEVYETLWIKKLRSINKREPCGGLLDKQCEKQWREANKQTLLEKNKQYREDNKEAIVEKNKKYYEANKQKKLEKRKERITCECGEEVCKAALTRHKETKKHADRMH